jgi:hypothetical protein
MATFQCTWPDGRVTNERHCSACRLTWHRQLKSLGAKMSMPTYLTATPDDAKPPAS